jgi:hypothetical protein
MVLILIEMSQRVFKKISIRLSITLDPIHRIQDLLFNLILKEIDLIKLIKNRQLFKEEIHINLLKEPN